MFLCLAYCSQLTRIELLLFFCITPKSLTLLHIYTLYCVLARLLIIRTTITIALVLKNKVIFSQFGIESLETGIEMVLE